MSKKKISKSKQPASKIPETPKVEVIPPDLQLQWDSVQAVATAFKCVKDGNYPFNYHDIVKASMGFLMKLHENMVLGALKHPQAHMISELKELLKEKKKEASNEQKSSETAAN